MPKLFLITVILKNRLQRLTEMIYIRNLVPPWRDCHRNHSSLARTIIAVLIAIFCLSPVSGYKEIYDITGEWVINADTLYEFWSYQSDTGGYNGRYYSNWVHWDRFLAHFGSEVTLHEWINNKEYELKLGRFETWFTPLTLHKTRFRWGYMRAGGWGDNWWDKYYNAYAYDWGRWWEQRNARLRVTKGKDEWLCLLAKTAAYGDDDDADNGWWNEGDIDKDRYFFAMRRKTELSGIDVGLSFVNQHYSNYTNVKDQRFYSAYGPFVGQISDNPPTVLYLKFTDDSHYKLYSEAWSHQDGKVFDDAEIDWNGAWVYDIRVFINGVEEESLRVKDGINDGVDVSYSNIGCTFEDDHVEVNGPWDSITYTFQLPGQTGEIKDVQFLIDVSHDYKIEVSRDNWNYYVISRAESNIRDSSNRTVVEYHYGEHTGNTVLGVDLAGTIPNTTIAFKTEFAGSSKFFKYPNTDGKRSRDIGHAYYVELSKDIFPALVVLKYFDVEHNYDAAFAVEDNDDHDDLPDNVDGYVGWFRDIDRDADGQPDYNQDFLLFNVDREFRRGIYDYNNNSTFDAEENDIKPNYPYNVGEKGYHILTAIRPLPDLKIEPGYQKKYRNIDDKQSKTAHMKTTYDFTIPQGTIWIEHRVKRAKDEIQDSLVYNPDWPNPWAYQLGVSWTDPLIYRDTLSNHVLGSLDYTPLERLNTVVSYRYGVDKRYYSEDTYILNYGVFRMRYRDWYPFKKLLGTLAKWQVVPMYKMERDNGTSYKDEVRYMRWDWRQDSFALVGINRLTDKTRLFIGEQMVLRNDILSTEDYTRYIFATELVHMGNYRDRPLTVKAGVQFVTQVVPEFSNKSNRQKYQHLYLNAYFVW